MKDHIQKRHPELAADKKNIILYPCFHCPEGFYKFRDFFLHMNDQHDSKENLELMKLKYPAKMALACMHCKYSCFITEKAFLKHTKKCQKKQELLAAMAYVDDKSLTYEENEGKELNDSDEIFANGILEHSVKKEKKKIMNKTGKKKRGRPRKKPLVVEEEDEGNDFIDEAFDDSADIVDLETQVDPFMFVSC